MKKLFYVFVLFTLFCGGCVTSRLYNGFARQNTERDVEGREVRKIFIFCDGEWFEVYKQRNWLNH